MAPFRASRAADAPKSARDSAATSRTLVPPGEGMPLDYSCTGARRPDRNAPSGAMVTCSTPLWPA